MTTLLYFAKANDIKAKRKKYVAHGVTGVFVLAESPEQAEQFIAEDRYGLQKRGYQYISTWKLTQTGGSGIVLRQNGAAAALGLPKTGCYETCMWAYREGKDGA